MLRHNLPPATFCWRASSGSVMLLMRACVHLAVESCGSVSVPGRCISSFFASSVTVCVFLWWDLEIGMAPAVLSAFGEQWQEPELSGTPCVQSAFALFFTWSPLEDTLHPQLPPPAFASVPPAILVPQTSPQGPVSGWWDGGFTGPCPSPFSSCPPPGPSCPWGGPGCCPGALDHHICSPYQACPLIPVQCVLDCFQDTLASGASQIQLLVLVRTLCCDSPSCPPSPLPGTHTLTLTHTHTHRGILLSH